MPRCACRPILRLKSSFSRTLRFETLESRSLLAGDVVISEFLAANQTGLLDEDGDSSDWIELHNTTTAPIGLAGYYLTDDQEDLDRWQFPSVMLPADGYLVVFASGKDRRVAGSNLHTNFKLNDEGEYLALVKPDLSIEYDYAPEFPTQHTDISYGASDSVATHPLVDAAMTATLLVPTETSLADNWRSAGFDDSSWQTVTTGVGFQNVPPGPTAMPVGYWTFDDTPSDSSGRGHTATLTATGVVYSSDVPATLSTGKSLSFGGGFRQYTVVNSLDVAEGGMTLSMWFKTSISGTGLFSVAQGNLGFSGADRHLYLSNGNIVAALKTGNQTETIASTGQNYADGTWHHIAYVFQQGSTTQRIYIDGNPTPVAVGNASRSTLTGQDRIYLGFSSLAQNDWFNGQLDDVTVWGTALYPEQIHALYAGISPLELQSYASDIATDIGSSMQGINSTAYLRVPFDVSDPAMFDVLALQMKYDDGFVAYLNGMEVARKNAPSSLAWNSAATARSGQTALYETIDLTSHLGLLHAGSNLLAIQGLNRSAGDADFLILPRLIAYAATEAVEQYYSAPSPGAPNDVVIQVAKPQLLRESSIVGANMLLEISVETAGAAIYYTLDGSLPSPAAMLYTGPFALTQTTQVRARAYRDGLAPSDIVSRFYTRVAAEAASFSSNLPLIVINTYSESFDDSQRTNVTAHFLNDAGRRTSLMSPQELTARAGMRLRGQSTEDFPKSQYAFEFRDELGADKNATVFGMPADSDWILYGPYSDKALINNALMYELSNDIGVYAVRTQYVELFINDDGVLTSSDYAGLYVFMESIKRSEGRLGLEPLSQDDDVGEELTGGYIFSQDGDDDGTNRVFFTSRYHFLHVYPDAPDITPAQSDYLANYLTQLETALYGPEFVDPTFGYQQYLDVQSFVDHHLLEEIAKNVDGPYLSTYFHKDRGGKVAMGPIWDYNTSLGNANFGDGWDTSGWRPYIAYPFPHDMPQPYFARLFEDPDFSQQYADSYFTYRSGPWATNQILTRFDEQLNEIYEAAERDFTRWPRLGTYVEFNPFYGVNDSDHKQGNHPPRTFRDEVQYVRQWLHDRLLWMDSQFVAKPVLSMSGGDVAPGTQITLTGPANTTIYYTLDGTDPRLPGGGVKPGAVAYSGLITINANTKVTARAKNNTVTADLKDDWSGAATAVYEVDAPDLILSEIMYNPLGPSAGSPYSSDDYEFVEVTNVGATPLNLNGYKFTKGIDVTLGNVTLNPGQSGVIVKNTAGFASRYPGITPLGTFTGVLDNGGEDLQLVDNIGVKLFDGKYEDDWQPHTDGNGFSLVTTYQSPGGGSLYNLGDASDKWRASQQTGGNPGTADTGVQTNSVVINEIVSNGADFIELYNTTGSAINVGGWYLSDDSTNLTKYEIAAGTTIAAGGYLVFTEASHFGNAGNFGSHVQFGLSELGEAVFLSSAGIGGQAGGYRISEDFGAADPGVATGRYIKSTGKKDFVLLTSSTPGATNSGPIIAPVVITEIMYHPKENVLWLPPQTGAQIKDEFIEIQNRSAAPVDISGWKLTDGVSFTFPAGQTLLAGERALIVPIDPAAFRTKYGLAAGLKIYGPYTGNLDDGGEQLELARPGTPVGGETPFIRVDRITYDDDAPWSAFADGVGSSLSRTDIDGYGNVVGNWEASHTGGTPGAANTFIDLTPPSQVASVTTAQTGIGSADPRTNVSWTAASDAQSGIAYYNVYRRGSSTVAAKAVPFHVGTSTTVSFTDNTVMQGPEFSYQIAAVNNDGVEGPRSGDPTTESRVVGRYVFYNQSKFDGNDVGVNPADDSAIATDKTALLPGQTSSFANYISFNRGLNGLMVDIAGLPPTIALTPADFEFKVGNSSEVTEWTPVAVEPFVVNRPGAGVDGSLRVSVVWPTGAPIKQWLQVTVKANSNTQLAEPDVFHFGNAVGESGNVPGDYSVSITDELLARNNPVGVNPGTMVTNRFDYNRDGTVSVVDQLLARNNITTSATKLRAFTAPAGAQISRLSAQGLQVVIPRDEHSPGLATPSVNGSPSTGKGALTPDRAFELERSPELPKRRIGGTHHLSDELLELIVRTR